MHVLITGGTGFLGSALAARLRADGHSVHALGSRDADLTDPHSLDRLSRVRFDRVYHLAAWTQAGDFCLRHPGEQWVKNQQINTTVLAWWQLHQPQAKLIAMGTSCAYAADRELVEENYLEGQPIDSLYTYAMTKRMMYVGLRSLAKQFGVRYLCLVPSTLYGPGYHTDGRQMHFIFDLIRKILGAKLGGPVPVLWGDGHQKRELVYLDDFVDATVRLADTVDDDLVNIGAGKENSIREFAAAICDHVGYDFAKIRFDTTKYVGAKSKVLAVGKLDRLLPGRARTPLSEGLARTVEWFEANWPVIVGTNAYAA
jgi:GDP-L-fucose synthase